MLVGNANSYFINNKPIFLKHRIFTNFNTVFPVVVLVFDFEEFSEEVLHGHCNKAFSNHGQRLTTDVNYVNSK
jgi:hypothetical protein